MPSRLASMIKYDWFPHISPDAAQQNECVVVNVVLTVKSASKVLRNITANNKRAFKNRNIRITNINFTFLVNEYILQLLRKYEKLNLKQPKFVFKYKRKDILPDSWIGFNFSKLSVLPNLIYRFNTIPIKILASYLVDTDKLILKVTQK